MTTIGTKSVKTEDLKSQGIKVDNGKGDYKCQYCTRPAPTIFGNKRHESVCPLNPSRTFATEQCPHCLVSVSKQGFNNHVNSCNGDAARTIATIKLLEEKRMAEALAFKDGKNPVTRKRRKTTRKRSKAVRTQNRGVTEQSTATVPSSKRMARFRGLNELTNIMANHICKSPESLFTLLPEYAAWEKLTKELWMKVS